MRRRFPVGAEYLENGQTHVRVWAPASREVSVVSGGAATPLDAENAGYFSGLVALSPGTRYQFQLTDGDRLYPDPASRFQPDGPHGPSEVVDPAAFAWTDSAWAGVQIAGQVVYEMHVGTFTREGTWLAASRELAELARIGITLVEMMPIAEFNGRFGWGYDGVGLFAPTRLYGRPDDLRQFVDRAHALGVGVILDAVYNHLGPSGNYLRAFSPAYFTDKYENEWGDAINFDGDDAAPVREFFEANAAYWINEFHFDGLRLDATQQIFDQSDEHIIRAIGRAVRQAAVPRAVVLVAENEPQDARLVRPVADGGYGLDALWNDDFHHSAMVAITGHGEAYYNDTYGEPQEFVSAAKYGYLYQGQYYAWQRQPRGTPAFGLSPAQFVAYLQNHDQVANSARGLRAHQLTSPGRWRAITALTLLMPSTPMLFQGQEFSSSAPFLYFADFDAELSSAIRKGRGEFLTQFPSIVDFEARATLDDPASPATFERCKLDFTEREGHIDAYRLHEDLLRLRREDAAFQTTRERNVDGAVLSPHAFMLRLFANEHSDDRVLIVNLGADLMRRSIAEPLLAPPPERDWTVLWSTEDPRYGGGGLSNLWPNGAWRIPGESAVVLAPGSTRRPPRRPVRRRTA
ncbi:MAG TPA: malto-oligosyltrehalose trehalohydrolase [Vicinamibacterales bacterium]